MPRLARAPPLLHSHPLPTATARFLPRPARATKPCSIPPRTRIRASNSDPSQQQQVNLSVLRFTLGIPGLDESYLPRWLGVGFGALVLLNHFVSPSPTPAQLRSEALGLCLAAFSATLPFLGRFLEGADAASRVPLPEGSRQVFVMSDNLSAEQKEDMAWASYALLRNTNTTSVLIVIGNVLCVRGYWDPPADTSSKYAMTEWFKNQVMRIGFSDLKDALYLPNFSGTCAALVDLDIFRCYLPEISASGCFYIIIWFCRCACSFKYHAKFVLTTKLALNLRNARLGKILPDGVLSVLVQPVLSSPDPANGETKTEGVILLASNANYAYSEKDRIWIKTIANKFQCFQLKCTKGG